MSRRAACDHGAVSGPILVGAFLASAIEVIEMVAIVVAVGAGRSWRPALAGAGAGLVVLAALLAAAGPAVSAVPLAPLRLVVGALLLIFGLGWLRKGVLRVAREGWMAGGVGEEDVEGPRPGGGFDWTAAMLSFKGVTLEGVEVAVIVIALGSGARDLTAAIVGAALSVVVTGALGALAYRLVARIPRRTMQLGVGTLLTTFGTFWAGEGAGAHWPGNEWALLGLGAVYAAAALGLLAAVRAWHGAERLAETAR